MKCLEQTEPAALARAHLSDQTFAWLRTFLYEKTGIYYQDNKKYLLENRISRRMCALGYTDFEAYAETLRKGSALRELPLLINAVTINETYFFRNAVQMELLEESILPELVRAREADGSRRIRIWSAACSTGDEAYTAALVIADRLQPRYPRIRFEIVGTDVNTDVVETAKKGEYGPYAVRFVPEPYLSRYFSVRGDRYTLRADIRSMVQFKQMNLVDRTAMALMRGVDLVFCANVLIYFDGESKKQVLTSIHQALNDDGYLLVGLSEALHGAAHSFTPVRLPKAVVYAKQQQGPVAAPVPPGGSRLQRTLQPNPA